MSRNVPTPQNSIVAYFDIIGFSDIIKNVPSSWKPKPCGPAGNKLNAVMAAVLETWEVLSTRLETPMAHLYLFSDCGFVVYPLKGPKDKERQLTRCVGDLVWLADEFLKRDFYVRGGVSVGPVARQSNLLVGEAVVEAVRFEQLCPGPFILFPAKHIYALSSERKFIQDVGPLLKVPLKRGKGCMLALVIHPSDKGAFVAGIEKRAEHYLVYGPAEFAEFWDETHTLLNGLRTI